MATNPTQRTYTAPCPGCAMTADEMPHLSHLNARDTTLTFVSRAPLAEILHGELGHIIDGQECPHECSRLVDQWLSQFLDEIP